MIDILKDFPVEKQMLHQADDILSKLKETTILVNFDGIITTRPMTIKEAKQVLFNGITFLDEIPDNYELNEYKVKYSKLEREIIDVK